MPSDFRRAAPPDPGGPRKLLIRLILLPLLIVLGIVAVWIPIARVTGAPASIEQEIARLKSPTSSARQRQMSALGVAEHLRAGLSRGMSETERVRLSGMLAEIVERHSPPDDGAVRTVLLQGIGRVWQVTPGQEPMDSPEAVAARKRALAVLNKDAEAADIDTRKASILALLWWRGRAEVREAIPTLLVKLADTREDLDVRISAAVTLGNIATGADTPVVEALLAARADAEAANAELVWNASLALARLGRLDARPTLLMLLDRAELAKLRVYDRERNPSQPAPRPLTDAEQQRFLINAMEAVRGLNDAELKERLRVLSESDPSPRVRAAAHEARRE